MSKRSNSRKASQGRPLARCRKRLNFYRRSLRYEPLEERRLLAVVTVTTLGDTVNFSDGVTSLREAIFATNTVPGADTINFAPSLTAGGPATLLLTQGELAITDALTIAGPGAGLLTIDASGNDATPAVKDGQGSRVFNVDNGTSVVIDVGISGLTLKGGDVTGDGGAITSSENLTITDSTLSNNTASGRGGGVFGQTGTLLVSGSTFTGNFARGGFGDTGGGGAVASLGNATIDRSTLSGNTATKGGAIRAFGDLLVDHSTVSGNTASAKGGGISSYNTAAKPNSLTIRDSVIANNVAATEGGGVRQRYGNLLIERTTITGNKAQYGGGISAADASIHVQIVDSAITANTLTGPGGLALGYGGGVFLKTAMASVVRSTISGNSGGKVGGGIYLQGGGLTIDSSTVSGNSAAQGGGIASLSGFSSSYTTIITNSTISGNAASSVGGGIRNLSGLMSIRYSTITNNSAPEGGGSGICIGSEGFTPTDVRSSIIAGNVHRDLSSVSSNAFTSLGYNLIGTGNHLEAFNKPGDQTGVANPMLGPLANNGGPTMTHALLAGSPAINEGDLSAVASVNGVPTYDQRGTPFGRVFNGRIDIGAFEYQQASDLNLVVDTLVDESDGNYGRGDLSLREALMLANLYPSTDTIRFDPALTAGGPATIVLTQGTLRVTDSGAIIGPGEDLLTIKPNKGGQIFSIGDPTTNLSNVSLSGLTLTGATNSAISTSENLTVVDCTLSGNSSTLAGGAIYSRSGSVAPNSLTIVGCTISNNKSTNSEGGAIRKQYGSVTIKNSVLDGNTAQSAGGAISAADGGIIVTIKNSTISNNKSQQFYGGGVFVKNGNMTVNASTISGNSAPQGGGIYSQFFNNSYTLRLNSTMVSNNYATFFGGGVLCLGAAIIAQSTISNNSTKLSTQPLTGGFAGGIDATTLTLVDSAVSGNKATSIGGISCKDAEIVNSTLSGNTATAITSGTSSAAALFSRGGILDIRHSTITANVSSGLGAIVTQNDPGTTTKIYSSIVVGNVNGDVAFAGTPNPFVSLGYNLIGAGNAVASFSQPGDQTGVVNPILGPLANNGGPTMTHALLAGSPAINAGDPAAAMGAGGVPLNDQRGVPFIRVYGGRIDIGASEQQPTAYVLGDFNHDGVVDSSDYTILRKQMNQTVAPGTGADANGDGIINNADYLIWKSNYGKMPIELPQSPAAAPAVGLSEVATVSFSEQSAAVRRSSSRSDSGLLSVTAQFAWSASANQGLLRSSRRAVRSPGATSDLAVRSTRFDYAIEAWLDATGAANKRTLLEPVPGAMGSIDCTHDPNDVPTSLDSAVDEVFASL